jgi:hypothetical protein
LGRRSAASIAPRIFGAGAKSPPMASSAIRIDRFLLFFGFLDERSSLVVAAGWANYMGWDHGAALRAACQLSGLDRVVTVAFA